MYSASRCVNHVVSDVFDSFTRAGCKVEREITRGFEKEMYNVTLEDATNDILPNQVGNNHFTSN